MRRLRKQGLLGTAQSFDLGRAFGLQNVAPEQFPQETWYRNRGFRNLTDLGSSLSSNLVTAVASLFNLNLMIPDMWIFPGGMSGKEPARL